MPIGDRQLCVTIGKMPTKPEGIISHQYDVHFRHVLEGEEIWFSRACIIVTLHFPLPPVLSRSFCGDRLRARVWSLGVSKPWSLILGNRSCSHTGPLPLPQQRVKQGRTASLAGRQVWQDVCTFVLIKATPF
jgi:hypothetical protein